MRILGRACCGSAIALLVAFTGAAHAADDWNQWRGPNRDGGVAGNDWPADLDGLELQWRVELGKGYPGPIVADDRVFVVETVGDETVGVRALDRETGSELWTREWTGTGEVPFFARDNGDWVRSTPVYDGKTLFVGDMTEVILALDGTTGKERWRADMPERFGTKPPDFGFASSPLVIGDHLYVQAANSLVKLDKSSGATVWRSLESSDEIQHSGAFSSPVEATIDGSRQIVTLTRDSLYGVDPESGETLWARPVPNFRGMNILTPLVVDGAIFTSPYKQRSFLYSVGRSEGVMRAEQSWENKSSAYMSSPISIDGHIYMHLGNRRFECIDLKTGESRWRSEPLGKYWSMSHQADKILALDQSGMLHLIRANPREFELLDSYEVSEQETWGHLAVSGDQLFVRELQGIVAYRWSSADRDQNSNLRPKVGKLSSPSSRSTPVRSFHSSESTLSLP
jgi:outer membrane protein assembly factor BamB